MQLFYVIKADFLRWFGKKNFIVGFISILILNYFIVLQNIEGFKESNIINLVFYYMEDPFYIINFIVVASIMGTSYCEEKESGYFTFWIKRCNEKKYIFSKIINSFFSAFLLLASGMFCWILSLGIMLPWKDNSSDQFQVIIEQGVGNLLKNGHYIQYYIWYCVGVGMMAGVLSTGTFVISLFVKNRTVVIIFGAVLFYLNVSYLQSIAKFFSYWNMEQIFYFPYGSHLSDYWIILRAVIYVIIHMYIFTIVSYWQLKRERRNG